MTFPHDPALRVMLLARALRRVGVDGQPRLMHRAEADVMLYVIRRRWVPSLDVFVGWDDQRYELIVPLVGKRGVWAFGSEHNSRTLLRAFWRAVVETVFGVEARAAMCGLCHHHPLVFHSMDDVFEIEVSDDRGDEWYFVVRSAANAWADDMRSGAGTPELGVWGPITE